MIKEEVDQSYRGYDSNIRKENARFSENRIIYIIPEAVLFKKLNTIIKRR